MASPAVVGTPTESNELADVTTHNIARPAGVNGQLTIVIFGFDGGSGVVITPAAGYTLITGGRLNQGAAHGFGLFYHLEDGTESTNVDFTTDDLEKSASIVFSISGAENPATQVPECTTFSGASSTTKDPPSISPTGGSKDYLFITGFVDDGEEADDDTWGNGNFVNYSPATMLQKTTDVTGAATVNVSVAAGYRQATTATENPAALAGATDVAHGYGAFTIAVHPSSVVPKSLPAKRRDLEHIPLRDFDPFRVRAWR